MRCLKHYYLFYICKHLHSSFPHLVSYSRFVELQQQVLLPLVLFLKSYCIGQTTAAGINFLDSTSLKVRHIKREHSKSKTFDGIAAKGCGTKGWFFGFKLHIIINDKGEIISFILTQANVNDRYLLSIDSFIRNVSGKLYSDRGSISKKLAEILFVDGIQLVYKMRNNMKGDELPLQDRLMLIKRAVIESVNDELKNIYQIEHSRHRSFTNFITNLIAGLLAYSFLPKMPSIKVDIVKDKQFSLF